MEREFKDEIPEQIPDLNSKRICLHIFLWMIHKEVFSRLNGFTELSSF